MITLIQYFGEKHHTPEEAATAAKLLSKVNSLLHEALEGGYDYNIDPDTNSQISGSKGGAGDGGFRLPDSKTGAKASAHKLAHAVDVYDPERKLAAWCVLHKERLGVYGLYCEDFRYTPTWCHFQDIPPKSGRIIYIPSTNPPLAPALPGQTAMPFKVKV